LAVPASATLIWNGSGDPASVGYVLSGSAAHAILPFQLDTENGVAHPGVAYQDTAADASASGVYKLLGATASSELSNAAGWTLETRVQTLQNTGDFFGMYFDAEDETGGLGILLHSTSIDVYKGDFSTYPTPGATIALSDNGYHIIGIQVAPGATSGHVWVDGIDSATVALGVNTGVGVAFGDGSSGSGGQANWDYVNLNAGLYQVPEPSTLALVISGLVGLLCYAWRKRK
jgi:hypothetical protein